MVTSLVSICFSSTQLGHTIKKLHETSDCWSRDMVNFNFPKKVLGLVSPTNFVRDFSRKKILISNN